MEIPVPSAPGGSSDPLGLIGWVVVILCLVVVLSLLGPLISVIVIVLSLVWPLIPIIVVVGAVAYLFD